MLTTLAWRFTKPWEAAVWRRSVAGVRFWDYSFTVQAGETYYLQIGEMWEQGGVMHLNLDFMPAPANDDITNALLVSLGDSIPVNNSAAGIESGEPWPTCSSPNQTVWFTFTPTIDMAVTAHADQWWNFVAAYTAVGPNNLREFGCRSEGYPLPLQLVAGTTYYFQAGSRGDWAAGDFTFSIYGDTASRGRFRVVAK